MLELLPKLVLVMALLHQPSPLHHHHKPKSQTEEATSTPAPTPTAAPIAYTQGPGALSEAQVASYARQAGFPESAVSTIVAYAYRESHWCPSAVYGYGCDGTGHAYAGGPSCGLTQLYPCPGAEYLDPLTNMRAAYAKYQASGWAPWGG